MRSAARWPRPPTRRAFTFGFSMGRRARPSARLARKRIACSTGRPSGGASRISPICGCSRARATTWLSKVIDVAGVVTQVGVRFECSAVVLTAGTFLNGRIHVGLQSHAGGRAGDPPAITLSSRLKELKLPQGRLKTGTPPRIDGRSIDYSKLTEQPGDGTAEGCDPCVDVPVFSFLGDPAEHPRQVPCWITQTNARTHEIIRSGFAESPMFTGRIDGVGPALLPEHRRQGESLRRQGFAPDLPRARRPDDARGLSERHLDLAALSRPDRGRAVDRRPRAGAHPAAGLRHRIRLLRSTRA